ncbi:5'-nucleotidase /3'-nucleotidase /exopolyphosphatase [Abditibacterium utsteinense]|uniref:5'-nucleotidase SurE n=1 Tax=Abditibacterium utsteinense TaxID=1960156 RepID=A0A2S8SU50_9BACT|nr:5'/3'-nucleotidase SurE [Abditibacterium utsteinense]PQV64308.1 5'-nucleotidase /3'-nucleotidase /exopolyphosphatase [Abditibacterium utsteinense]
MKILITNDDGIGADGLHAAWNALNAAGHQVSVCVPDRPRSACSHQITMHKPLRVKTVETRDGIAHTTNGTPADCVTMALLHILKTPPDLCISGINLGPNLGDDVHYSGTVGGAMEAVLNGIPALAISLDTHSEPNWEAAAQFCTQIAPRIKAMQLPRDTFLNVNVPNLSPQKIQGFRVTSQGSRRYKGDLTRYEAPVVGEYFWRGGEVIDRAESDDADVLIVKQGFISVTPIHVDLTRRDAMQNVASVLGNIETDFHKK